MAQKSIETGVDKLVDFINHKKRLSINEAASELGVSVAVVQEWADFLEDEGLITIEYKLSKTYLCERKLSKGEVEKKAKEYSSKKDAFTRKVENALTSLEKESEGFEKVKEEFHKLKDAIGSDIDQVREELQELRHYEDLKKNIDKDIIQQKFDYQEMLENVRRQVAEQKKKYDALMDDIGQESSKIEEAKVEMSYLEKREENLSKRMGALQEIIKSIQNKIEDHRKTVGDSVQKMESDIKAANKLEKEMRYKMNSELEPIINAAKDKGEKILAVQESMLKKIMAKKDQIEKYKSESLAAADKFKSFFDKKAKTQELIGSLDKEKAELSNAMRELINKAQSFNLSLKSANVSNYAKDLQKSFDDIEKKKKAFIDKVDELTDTINSKDL